MRALAALLLLAGCAGHSFEPRPAGIPYVCTGGSTARIVYEGGGYFPRARARLSYDGREIALSAVPPTYGLRYVSEGEPILIWSTQGEQARLSEMAADGAEREIARCTRVR